jgi:hypothetical protein
VTARATTVRTIVLGVLLLTALAACGGNGDDSVGGAADGPTTTTPTTTTTAGSDEDPANPWVIGFRVTIEEGDATVETSAVGVYNGEDQQPLTTNRTVKPDDPTFLLFTNFIESATVTVTVTDGGPVTIEGIRGRLADAENPFAGIEVRDVLSSTTASAGDEVTIDLP